MDGVKKLAYICERLAPKSFSLDALELIATRLDDITNRVADRMAELAKGRCLERAHVVQALNERARGEL